MAELIATSSVQADSGDFTLVAGSSTTLYLKDAAGPTLPFGAAALVQVKSGTEYFTIGTLDDSAPAQVLTAVGTFRVRKLASSTGAFGVDRD